MSQPDPTDRTSTTTSTRPTATRVVLSMPAGVSDWVRSQIDTDRYRGYFRRTLGDVAVGEVTEEFVDVGCCGSNLDVPFRVERIEVGDGGADDGPTDGEPKTVESAIVDDDTTIEYVDREGDVEGGWAVQSEAGPTR
ncbi:hypothetical protein [Halopenitus sp. POP-27]|uniref:hypothetical protein n=1 Tax=Halopenitus sp. POP-27 TaxID=2994425 RepID=UPI0024699222|nr:hypothetical protein [Halopenitus sp. POP-27]